MATHSSSDSTVPAATAANNFDIVIVGAGFAGLYMLHRARELGLSARVFEAGSGVGGTWYWNRYPGARCDVESMEYSYQFSEALQQEWQWRERYATQPEILRYLNHVADRFQLRPHIQLDTSVEAATFTANDDARPWTVKTNRGTAHARFLVMATGCLSAVNRPEFAGMDEFGGQIYHTGRWPREGVSFAGKRVGVIGTGSSAIQCIPLIAKEAEHLYVFQRTPNYTVPAHNAPLDPDSVREVKANYAALRQTAAQTAFGVASQMNEASALATTPHERERIYEKHWQDGGVQFMLAFADLLIDRDANQTASDFIRGKIRAVVRDPAVAEALSPNTILGCKRLCVDTDYYATFNRANVTLVDVSQAPVEAFTPTGVRARGSEYALDSVVLATGYDALTGALTRIDIRGSGGRALRDKWAEGPRTYLGLTTTGFPNLFIVAGPGSPSVLSNMVPSIEQHVNWIADCIAHLRERGMCRIEPTPEAEDAWVAHVNEVADTTLFTNCNSWYLGSNIPDKPRVFMPYLGFATYVEKCNQVVANGYEGFVMAPPHAHASPSA